MSNEIELKPCPYCGCDAAMKERVGFPAVFYAYVQCTECGATSREVQSSLHYCADEVAAKEWNRRLVNDS